MGLALPSTFTFSDLTQHMLAAGHRQVGPAGRPAKQAVHGHPRGWESADSHAAAAAGPAGRHHPQAGGCGARLHHPPWQVWPSAVVGCERAIGGRVGRGVQTPSWQVQHQQVWVEDVPGVARQLGVSIIPSGM